jgi:alpha-tubulin suppressor-like RCC1 family protein
MRNRDLTKVAVLLGGLGSLLGCASTARPQTANAIERSTQIHVVQPSATWKSLAAGRSTTLAVKQDGSLWVWGWDQQGGGSDRTLENAPHIEGNRPPVALPPTRIGAAKDWASVAAADGSLLALKANGTLWSLGEEREAASRGDEDEDAPRTSAPVSSGFPAPHPLGTDADWRQITTARYHTLGLRTDGTLWGFGDNRQGQLGDGTTEERTAPARIGKERWRSVATSPFHTVAIREDGTLWVWGWRAFGWEGGPEKVPSPVQLGTEAGWQDVSCSSSHALAINSDGTLWSYGGNDHGELGLGKASRMSRFELARVGQGSDWLAASAGNHFSLAIKRDGSLWAFGENYQGQLGDGTTEERPAPVNVGKGSLWRAVHAGEAHVVAEAMDGSTWTWGSDRLGQLGDGRPLVLLEPAPVQPGSKWRFAAGEEGTSIGLRADGAMWSWGSRRVGSFKPSPAEWKALAHHRGVDVIGIQKDGSLWDITWHEGKLEQIQKDPWRKGAGGQRWARLSATQHGILAQDEQDGLWYFHRVQIGNPKPDGSTREIWQPEPLGKPGEWGHAFAAVNPGVVLAQKKDGTFWLFEQAWNDDQPPVMVDKRVDWESVIADEHEILLLGKNGQLWRFDGEDKQRVGTSSEWRTASVSSHHSLAVRKDGTLWSWGQGEGGELGTVYAGEQPSPVRIGRDANWAQAVAAGDHSLALKQDGTLWAFGNNLNGQLGVGAPLYRTTPAQLEIP